MHDTRNNVILARKMAWECHLGTKNTFVDHEMIAAGTRSFIFELDSFFFPR